MTRAYELHLTEEPLKQLSTLGADGVIDLKQSDEQLAEAFLKEAGTTGYHVILDYLWGHPTEILIRTLVPRDLSFAKHPIRLIQIGEAAGLAISLTADALRTSGLAISGAGAGKTTVVRILTTLLKPDSGHAEISGLDVARRAAAVRSRIGLAGQYAAVDENLTGYENLKIFGQLYHLSGAAAR